ncbi:MAG TPA: SGNH/GDSL hydrolase family protein [Rhizomicrobium sp.]|nr:SGNH/GDSL hydrolase family protein [Rhizomicrobium sp.]
MKRAFAVLMAVLIGAAPALAQTRDEHWTGSWATSQQIPEERNALPAHALDDATLRQSVHLSLQGESLRVRLSNAFGTTPLHITAAHIARVLASGSDAIEPDSDTLLHFSGAADVTIPAGAEYVSDPVSLTGTDLAISLHFETAPVQQTSHPGSRTTSYLLHGDHVADAAMPGAEKFDHWFNIAGIDVSGGAGAVVALGDSITDGRGSTTNGNDRWTDALAHRLADAGLKIGVLNHGIGGGHVLLDGLGPNAMSRLDRDVLAQPGARWLIVFEAINDIGTFDPDGSKPEAAHQALVHQLTTAYSQMIESAHAAGIKIYGATITPFMDCGPYHPKPISEADRVALNAWVRSHFDAVIDFDAVVRDPARPDHLAPSYDSGDGLHLSPAGYRALAAAIPLSLFR